MSDTIENIKKILLSPFEVQLFESSLKNLIDLSNKLRYHNFAYSIRELSRHFLLSLSPDDRVLACEWFTVETDNGKPSRTQRIKYAIQGGITDDLLILWKFDVIELKETISDIKKTIDSLSKYTHINPDTFDLKDEEIENMSQDVLLAFESFVNTIYDYRNELKYFLDEIIEDHMISSVVTSSFTNIDVLAPHYSLDFSEVSEYHISEINESEIVVDVSGNVHVTLEYGSKAERREGDGLDLDESFPFDTKIRYTIGDGFPNGDYEVEDFDVDTSDWYGNEDEDQEENYL